MGVFGGDKIKIFIIKVIIAASPFQNVNFNTRIKFFITLKQSYKIGISKNK